MSRPSKQLLSRDGGALRKRFVKCFKDVIRASVPHWRPMALSFLLMFTGSVANGARLAVILPVFTQILGMEDSDLENEDVPPELKAMKKRGGGLVTTVEKGVGVVSQATSKIVSPSWYESELVDAKGDPLTGKAREARADLQHFRYATLLSILFLMIILVGIMCFSSYMSAYASVYATLHILMDIKEKAIGRVLSQPVSFFDKEGRGEMVARVIGDVGAYGTGLTLVFNLVRVAIDIVVKVAMLIWLAPALLLMFLIAIPFLMPMRRVSAKVLKRSHKRQEEGVKVFQKLLQVFTGVRTVKAFAAEKRHVTEFRELDEVVTRRALKVQRAKSSAGALITFLNNTLIIVLVLGGGMLVFTNRIDVTPAELFVAMLVLTTVYQPIKRVVKHFNNFVDSMASIERATVYLELPDGLVDRPGATEFTGLTDAIRFEDVHFHYNPGEPVLQGIDFEIPKGTTTALVGPSGGGKSTICDLLLGFYDATSGSVRIDGRDRRDIKRASFLDRAAIVSQSPFLFHSTIGDNIRQGRMQATMEEIQDAARAANIHDAIISFPLGYDEVVGEDGVRLSGGQRQRITIARALVRDPDVLVLDEATASLDTASEKAVQDALDNLRRGRTTLVVAHRLSTIRQADQILVIEGGRIVERGTHDDLIVRDGTYAQLVKMQDLSPSSA
jgi:ABC-type multidrug transport system fused ATPase/permease subunit